jgi:ligand-binding sensor domain-containing protein
MSLLICVMANIHAQHSYSFSKLSTEHGLNDGHVESIGQDKYGYMWFGTLGGLNRFDGNTVKSYTYKAGDSTSIPPSLITSMATDSSGRFFIGFENGMREYDFTKNAFRKISIPEKVSVNDIAPVSKDRIFLATSQGLIRFNPLTNEFYSYISPSDSLLKHEINKLLCHRNKLYIACENGLLVFDLSTQKTERITVPQLGNVPIIDLALDAAGNLWLSTMGAVKIMKLSPDFKQYESYDQYLTQTANSITNKYLLTVDAKKRIWIQTKLDGIVHYNPFTNKLEKYLHDPLKSWTPSTNLHISIFCSKEGIVWVGSTSGVNYFNPDKTLFNIIQPFNNGLENKIRLGGRAVTEDHNRNLWFATADGLSRYNPSTNAYTEWSNRDNKPSAIYFNSTRGVTTDSNNDVWIATGKGLNRYQNRTGKMDFFSIKDSVPEAGFMSATNDNMGNVWFGCANYDGFYYYNLQEKKFHSIKSHPQLKKIPSPSGWMMLQDSKNRYWFGLRDNGIAMYDPATDKVETWNATDKTATPIAGNIMVDIKEDKKGIIWISTYYGLSGIDPASKKIISFNNSNGLFSNTATGLAIDSLDRLWIGTSRGLMVLDGSRKFFNSFGVNDGLPSLEFHESPALTASNGDFIMSTNNGYVRFNPIKYQIANKKIDCYLSSFKIFDKEVYGENINEMETVDLKYKQNFFTISFTAVDFENPANIWYAYKLDGVDKDWIYTKNRFATYTNLAGGNYVFHCKATSNFANWDVEEKTIAIHIDTVFYMTWWFRIGFVLLLIIAVAAFSKYRRHQREKLMELEGKAQLLEKEKALVMYESLKQQLNPHFLFNSLTSLSSLIRVDQKSAVSFLDSLSKTYRYILKSRDNELVNLMDELKFGETYIQLQLTRFQKGLIANIHVDPTYNYHKIAPVTLQNLIENAIKHNIIDEESPLVIEIYVEAECLIVRNNLQKKNFVETSNKQGLANMQSLYQYLTTRPLEIREDKKYFTVSIPLL